MGLFMHQVEQQVTVTCLQGIFLGLTDSLVSQIYMCWSQWPHYSTLSMINDQHVQCPVRQRFPQKKKDAQAQFIALQQTTVRGSGGQG